MSEIASETSKKPPKQKAIEVTVRFQFSHKEAFEQEYQPGQNAGQVRTDAVAYYEVANDPNNEYYLTGEDKLQVPDDALVGDLAGGKKHLKLKLNRRTTSGS